MRDLPYTGSMLLPVSAPSIGKHVRSVIVVLFVLAIGCLGSRAATIEQAGGSDFVAFDTDPAQLRGSPQAGANWLDGRVYHAPHCQYDMRMEDVNRAMRAMRDAGQKKLGLNLWTAHFGQPDDCHGFLANSAGGHLTPRVMANLQHMITQAGALGFDEIQLRFNPMAGNMVQSWGPVWNQAMFDENWGVVASTVSALSQSRGPHLLYDLGGELAGTECPQCHAYVRRMWKAFTQTFPGQDSYGFSIAIAPGRVRELLDDLRAAGPLPSQIALDTYHAATPGLRVAAEEMRAAGVDLPILIQETTYADPVMYRALVEQARRYHLRIQAVMQWPLRAGVAVHVSEAATPDYIYWPVP